MSTPLNHALDRSTLESYLSRRWAEPIHIVELAPLGGTGGDGQALKQFGYGHPLLITYETGDGLRREVLHTIRRTPFGREREDDRVAAVWLDYLTFNELENHVPVVDLVMLGDGKMASLDHARSLHVLSEYRPGTPYAEDLLRLRDGARAVDRDFRRAGRLAQYLAGIHGRTHDDPWLWRRRLRDLVGHGEGIMGLTDSYPADFELAGPDFLREIESGANRWRWRLKPLIHRLAQVHGDFHPFNILFDEEENLVLLDRSRGAWGEPADDVSCLSVNYIFFSLQRTGRFEGDFAALHSRFWDTYLEARSDPELLEVIQPWLAWRLLVVASPVWYPDIAGGVRRRLLAFARNVLQAEQYAYDEVERYWHDE